MSLQFYRDEAARQRSAGDASPLQNVRERCERAALALDALAIRSERGRRSARQSGFREVVGRIERKPGLWACVARPAR